MDLGGKVIAVTGAGSGIGRALSLLAAKRGAHVAGFDLRADSLAETSALVRAASGRFLEVTGDVSKPESATAFVGSVLAEYGAVDVLVNNAGIIQPFVHFTKLTPEQADRVFGVNWFGVVHMTRAFLPELRARPEAALVNVSSMGAFCPVPGQGVYGASKAAVKLFTESLALELAGSKVLVACVFPGGVRTNITENAPGMPEAEKRRQRDLASSSSFGLSAEDAAEQILRGVEKGRTRIVVGADAKLFDRLSRLAPRRAGELMAFAMKRAGVVSEGD